MNTHPKTLFIETSTRCNLSCPMCARSGPGWQGGAGDMSWPLFESLAPDFARAQAVVLNGMGEPLLHPDLPRMIRLVKERQPADGWCGLQTNGLLLTETLAGELARAGLDVVCISCDGSAGLGHGPGAPVARAARLLRAAGGHMRLGLETVLMRGNVAELPALVDFAASLGLDFMLATHLLPMDQAAEAEGLFVPCSAAALRLFQNWRDEAGPLGLDLVGAARAAVKYHRTPQEAALLELVQRMHQSARDQGLWLNLPRLADTDQVRLAELADIFGQARNRAESAGLELVLPELTAPERPDQRRCSFVDKASAFIDWQGNVSPCHFLWHGYDCRVLGDFKRVHPQHFGNISATPLADIWQSPAFRVFCGTVQAGDYPSCGDCSLGLCWDASGVPGPFEQDCFGASVPCGHCPWALGQLLCLGS